MPYAINQGVKIYYEVEGAGPPLMLAHGLAYSGEDWREFGYVDLLKQDYQLILVDHRGHGRSDKPHDPKAYSYEMRVKDHTAVLDDLGISQAHFWGYSLGGAVGFNIAKWAAQRFHSLILGGEDPYPPSKVPKDTTIPYHKPLLGVPHAANPILELLKQGGEAWVRFREANMPLTPAMKTRYQDNDFQALLALWQSPWHSTYGDFPWGVEIAPLLPRFPLPCLLYVGEAEDLYPAVKEAAAEMPDATFVSFPEYNHVDIWVKSEEVVPHVRRFLDRFNAGGDRERVPGELRQVG